MRAVVDERRQAGPGASAPASSTDIGSDAGRSWRILSISSRRRTRASSQSRATSVTIPDGTPTRAGWPGTPRASVDTARSGTRSRPAPGQGQSGDGSHREVAAARPVDDNGDHAAHAAPERSRDLLRGVVGEWLGDEDACVVDQGAICPKRFKRPANDLVGQGLLEPVGVAGGKQADRLRLGSEAGA